MAEELLIKSTTREQREKIIREIRTTGTRHISRGKKSSPKYPGNSAQTTCIDGGMALRGHILRLTAAERPGRL